MTSNLGSDIIAREENGWREKVNELLKRSMRPEFLNRIDETIIFSKLGSEDIRRILELQLNGIKEMLEEKNIILHLDGKAMEYLSSKGFNPDFGARPIKRLLQKELVNHLASMLISGQLTSGSTVEVSSTGDGLTFA